MKLRKIITKIAILSRINRECGRTLNHDPCGWCRGTIPPGMPILLLATNNPGKVGEIRALLADLPLEIVTPADLGLDLSVEETGKTYAENAALKARAFAAASGLPALADDSGLEVDALDGAPGLHSARYAPIPSASDADRRVFLLQALAGKPQPWLATFHSTVCLALPNEEDFLASGECRGEIKPEEHGAGGFGYDRLFYIEGLGRTMAELTMKEKNQVSHRAKAIEKMREILRQMI